LFGGYWAIHESTPHAQNLVNSFPVTISDPGGGVCQAKDDKMLSPGEVDKLKNGGVHPHDLKENARQDLYKDKGGNIVVKPKGGNGPGEPTGLNINDF
jgi:hypothetical protein